VTAIPDHITRRLTAGDEIDARYRLEAVAGTGGMATVWRAHDNRLQRPVAIKVISDTLAASPDAVARFAREARTHAKIQHPNLVQVYDSGVTGPQPYLVMEYIDGATLSERLDRDGFSPTAIATLARELLSALACVHDHGVLHRDIKPANILLGADDRARLTDFGVARLDESTRITRPNEIVGTLRFLAPELLEGRPATRQSDLFALGVLLRTAAAETTPPPEVEELIKSLTQPSPQARPADAHAALAALDRAPKPDPTRVMLKPSRPAPRGPAGPAGPTEPTPITRPTRPTIPRRPTTKPITQQVRKRLVAVSALVIAAIGTTLIVSETGAGNAHGSSRSIRGTAVKTTTTSVGARSTATTAPYRKSPTIDQQLQTLANTVKRAAGH
jgi:serine/threonine protein kinase